MRDDPRLEIGGVARAHGIRGEVVVVTHDPKSTIVGEIELLWIGGKSFRVATARSSTRGWLVQLEGIDTRTLAEGLRGQVVEVDRSALEIAEGDVLLDDLVGCAVRRVDGLAWGTIVAVEGGMQDRLVIHDGEIERMLPLVDAFVVDIDLEAKLVTVDPPEGLPETRIVPRRHEPDA
ncbi:MAG: 16S rRNA processing protein RimM [Deltaproteobacteria bacterium]|nr:16S rRNA processing protein RimM [Deltaproteobacteria bacterium]